MIELLSLVIRAHTLLTRYQLHVVVRYQVNHDRVPNQVTLAYTM